MSWQGRTYGLFVGVDRYESQAIRPLSFASADALAIRDRLGRFYGLQKGHDIALVEAEKTGLRPTRRAILEAMNRFTAAPMDSSDTFFFVFAGHGFVCSGKSYLAATDSEIGSEVMLRETAISLDSVGDFLGEIRAGQHVVILDACRDSPIQGTRSMGDERMPDDMARDIGAVICPPVTRTSPCKSAKAILASCWEGQVAHEYERGGHGWFCYNLLAELDGMSAERVSLAELHARVKQRMKDTAWQLLPHAADQAPHLVIDGDVPYLTFHRAVAEEAPHAHSQWQGDGSTNDPPVQDAPSIASTPVQSCPEASVATPTPKPEAATDRAKQMEQHLLAGRPWAALQALSGARSLSPRLSILRCLAVLMSRPMRKLRNAEATDLVESLRELLGTSEQSLATALLAGIAEHYYRPLRRRLPSGAGDEWDLHKSPLDAHSLQLASLIPEVQSILSDARKGPNDHRDK